MGLGGSEMPETRMKPRYVYIYIKKSLFLLYIYIHVRSHVSSCVYIRPPKFREFRFLVLEG